MPLPPMMASYSYDRRASKPMSNWLWKAFDVIAKANQHTIDEFAKDSAEDSSRGEQIVLQHPNASDEELAKLALAQFSFDWEDIIQKESPRITKWINLLIQQAAPSVATEDDYFTRLDARHGALTVDVIAWGTETYNEDEDDWNRTELPAQDDLHDDAIERKFKATGAEARVKWEWQKNPDHMGLGDVVAYPIHLVWHYDEKALSQRYGAAAFEHAFKAKLPELRAEAAQSQPIPPPKPRGRRR